jgi:hypothetical protein
MARDIEDIQPEVIFVEAKYIQSVASQLSAGTIGPGETQSGDVGEFCREKRALDFGGCGQVCANTIIGYPQRLLGFLLCGDIGLDTDEMRNLTPLVSEGRDG